MFEFYLQKKGDFQYSKIILTVPTVGRVNQQNLFEMGEQGGWSAEFDTKVKYISTSYIGEQVVYFRFFIVQLFGFGISWQWQNGY